MANLTFNLLFLMVTLAHFPRHESAVIRHELGSSEKISTEELYNSSENNDVGSYRKEHGKLIYLDTEKERLSIDDEHGFEVNENDEKEYDPFPHAENQFEPHTPIRAIKPHVKRMVETKTAIAPSLLKNLTIDTTPTPRIIATPSTTPYVPSRTTTRRPRRFQ